MNSSDPLDLIDRQMELLNEFRRQFERKEYIDETKQAEYRELSERIDAEVEKVAA
jgi:hypothetical protein